MNRIQSLIPIVFILAGCASISSPNGGPKDKIPPKLLSSLPQHNTTGFRGKTIQLTFDEDLKLKNPKEEMIISPSVGREIDVTLKGNRVLITPKNGWADSTTYNIVFREAIQDITEGNVPADLRLAFSTGPEIDTLHISGRVTYLLKGSNAEKITVAVYQSDTFNIFKHPASYLTKSDKHGVFRLDNLKEGDYHIYAFDDKNKNLKIESRTEKFGFLKDTLHLSENIDSLHLGLISLDTRPLKLNTIRRAGSLSRIRFSKAVVDYTIQSQPTLQHTIPDSPDELVIWNPQSLTDSVKITLSATDSLDNKLDTTFYVKKTDARTVKDNFKWAADNLLIDPETGLFTTNIRFNKPLKSIQYDSISILLDTTAIFHIPKEQFNINTKLKKINIHYQMDKKLFEGNADPLLNITIGKGFLVSIDNDSTKALKDQPTIPWPETTGILLLQTETTHKNYIVQLLSPEGHILHSYPNLVKQTIKQIPPGDYAIRIIIDANANQRWDAGNPILAIEPEPVIYYLTNEKKRSFPIRANWELGPLILKF
ncbi:MAG: Ig-like domain-containing protein [Bacteroidetes bacterium]|nr:Ig-like domain-containing protein [Bacteroidota bacterium]